jgi:hypothetical protein
LSEVCNMLGVHVVVIFMSCSRAPGFRGLNFILFL